MSEDGQVISGTFMASSEEFAQTQCRFAVRRVYWDPLYVKTTPGDFSCAGPHAAADSPLNGDGTGGFSLQLSPTAPRPSCFSGGVSAIRMRPTLTGRFTIGAETAGGVAGEDHTRRTAVFSACDGQELACGSSPGSVTVQLTQFQDVLLLAEGDGYVTFRVDYSSR
jgi:hypothetical protein